MSRSKQTKRNGNGNGNGGRNGSPGYNKRPLKPQVRSVRAPLQKSAQISVGTPQFGGGRGSDRSYISVSFREIVRTSLLSEATAGFTHIDTYEINPGLVKSFPWLSQIANRYDQYELCDLRVEYVNAAPATRQGFIYMVPDYDVYDGTPTTVAGAMNQMGSLSGPVWESAALQIRQPAAMSVGPRRFVRQGLSIRDQSLTDVAKVHIFTSDVDGALPGQIWMAYTFKLFAPQMNPTVMVPRGTTHFTPISTPVDTGTNYTDATPIPLGVIADIANGLGLVKGSNATFKIKPGVYRMAAAYAGHSVNNVINGIGKFVLGYKNTSSVFTEVPVGLADFTSTALNITAGDFHDFIGDVLLSWNESQIPADALVDAKGMTELDLRSETNHIDIVPWSTGTMNLIAYRA